MTKGRKRLPTEIKQRQGTNRLCRENGLEPDYMLTQEIPDPPKYLSKIGRDVYYSTAQELLSLGILTRVSLSLFVMYCTQVAIYFDAMEQLSKEGNVILVNAKYDSDGKLLCADSKANPYIKIANDSLAASVRIACEFGITPASSSKVNAIQSNESKAGQLVKRLQKK